MRIKQRRGAAAAAGLLLLLGMGLAVGAQGALQERPATRENITTLMLLRLTQALDLTEEQTGRIYPVFNRIEKDKLEVGRRLADRMRHLRFLLREEKLREEETRAAMDEIRSLRDQIKQKDSELEAFVLENLNLEQQARFLLFYQDFYRQMRDKLAEVRRERRRLPAAQRLPAQAPIR